MAKQLQLRRGTTAQHSTFTGAVGEVTIDTDKDVVVVHDGARAGGFPSQKELVSGTNIKTINNTSLLGSGNIDVIQTISVTNIDELKDFVAPYDNYALNVLGYLEAGDGGGGVFYYDTNSTEDDNGGTIIEPTSGNGRWIRQYDGAVNVKWFGAKGDGVTDDTVAIQAAIDAETTIYFPSPSITYKIISPLTVTTGKSLIGEHISTGVGSTTANPVITKTTNSTVDVELYDSLTNFTARDAIIVIPLDATTCSQNIKIKGLSLKGNSGDYGIYIEQGGHFLVEDVFVFDVTDGLYARNIWVSKFEKLRSLAGIRVTNGGTSLSFINCSTGIVAGSGYYFNEITYSTLISCAADYTPTTAYNFYGCTAINMSGCGTEYPDSVNSSTGVAIACTGYNNIVISGFLPILKDQNKPTISAGENDNLTFIGAKMNTFNPKNTYDVYLADLAFITFKDSVFSNTSKINIEYYFEPTAAQAVIGIEAYGHVYRRTLSGIVEHATIASGDVLAKTSSGSWTPQLEFGGSTAGITYSSQEGKWFKNGNMVTAWAKIVLTNKGSATGTAAITGLPTATDFYVAFGGVANQTNITKRMHGYIGAGDTRIQLKSEDATVINITDTEFSNNSSFIITVTYAIASQ